MGVHHVILLSRFHGNRNTLPAGWQSATAAAGGDVRPEPGLLAGSQCGFDYPPEITK